MMYETAAITFISASLPDNPTFYLGLTRSANLFVAGVRTRITNNISPHNK